MTVSSQTAAAPGLGELSLGSGRFLRARFDLMSWADWLGAAITFGVLCAVVLHLSRLQTSAILEALPSSWFFWAIFAAYFLAVPFADWVIFRKLWRLPAAGFIALLRKNAANNLLLGYSGEAQFYVWARERLQMRHAPFPAIRDVAILSALAGNIVTLLMLVASHPVISSSEVGLAPTTLATSVAVLVGSSALILALQRRLIALESREQLWVLAIHIGRIIASTLLCALLWALALPDEPVERWVLLSTLRLVTSRLPFLPNRDFVLAAAATFLFGSDLRIAEMLAGVALLTLLAHLSVGLFLSVPQLAKARAR